MKSNVGTADRVARIVFALALFSLYFFLEGNARWFAAIGLVPLLTASISYCPLYSVFGISTCPAKKSAG